VEQSRSIDSLSFIWAEAIGWLEEGVSGNMGVDIIFIRPSTFRTPLWFSPMIQPPGRQAWQHKLTTLHGALTRASPFPPLYATTLALDSPSTLGSAASTLRFVRPPVCLPSHGRRKDEAFSSRRRRLCLSPSFPNLRLPSRPRRSTAHLPMARTYRKRRSSSADVEARFARAEAAGYVAGAHHEQDKNKNASKHNDKTKKNQNRALMHYVQ
jgi:hypothetical protein